MGVVKFLLVAVVFISGGVGFWGRKLLGLLGGVYTWCLIAPKQNPVVNFCAAGQVMPIICLHSNPVLSRRG